MREKPKTILGINPGAKYLGIAVFQGNELKDWRIKAFKGKWSKEKMDKVLEIISDYVIVFEVDVIALKKLHLSRSSEGLNQLVASIEEYGFTNGLDIKLYTIKDLEKSFSPKKRINKKQLAEIVTLEYPFLFHEFEKEKNHKNPYYIRMFEAVALGALCSRELTNS